MAEKQKKKDSERSQQDQELKESEVAAKGNDLDFDPETATPEQWQQLLAAKDEEIRELKERIMRLAAEMENTRKRLERERRDGIQFANESLIREFLPVLDNLERALEHADSDTDPATLLEGIRMTRKHFLEALQKFGCTPFESKGKAFDPNFHEAMLQQETESHPHNTVLQEYQKGYLLRDRLLRPALVVVAKSEQKANAAGPSEGSAGSGKQSGKK